MSQSSFGVRGQRLALACAAGFALLAGHAPIGWGWAGLVALVPLSLLARSLTADRASLRVALGWGMVAGAAFFGPLLWWIHHIGEVVAWPLLTLVLAPFVAAWVVLLTWWSDRRGRAVVAVAGWVALEALRTVAPFGGFPWGQLGYTQASGGPLLEAARGVGVLGLTGLLAAVAVSVEHAAVIGVRVARRESATAADAGRRDAVLPGGEAIATAMTPALAMVLALLVAGTLLAGAPARASGDTVDIAAVQGFDVQGSTGRELSRSLTVAEGHLEMTRQLARSDNGPPDLAVWPENALDHDVTDPDAHPGLRARLDAALDVLDGAPLLSGMIEERPDNRFVNSTVAFDGDGEVVGRYDKRQFVPFGEYVPFRELIEWFPPLERVPRDGIEGDGPNVIDVAGTRVGSIVCFEVAWPNLVRDQVVNGAEVIVVATNNSSFGPSAASDQHIALSQLRAVETGRWVVHAALSGRSALVAPDGTVHQRTGLYEQAVVRDDVPLVSGTTLALRVGDAPGWAAVAVLAAMVAGVTVRDRLRWPRRDEAHLPAGQPRAH